MGLVIGGVQDAPSISSQLFHIPGVDVATVVLEVVFKTMEGAAPPGQ